MNGVMVQEHLARYYTDEEILELFPDADGSMVNALLHRAQQAEAETERLQDELAANARLLARQCDLAREAETEAAQTKTAELRPVVYHENGNVKFPVTYTQLLRECERLHAKIERTGAIVDRQHSALVVAGFYSLAEELGRTEG